MPSQAGSIGLQGWCSATPSSPIEFEITATFGENLVPGPCETDLIFDPTLLQFISYAPAARSSFELRPS